MKHGFQVPNLNLIKSRIRMYLGNFLKLVLTKRSITVSSLSPVLALQRQRRQKRQSAQWSEIKNSILLFHTSPVLYFIWSEDIWYICDSRPKNSVNNFWVLENPSHEKSKSRKSQCWNVSMPKSPRHAKNTVAVWTQKTFFPLLIRPQGSQGQNQK